MEAQWINKGPSLAQCAEAGGAFIYLASIFDDSGAVP